MEIPTGPIRAVESRQIVARLLPALCFALIPILLQAQRPVASVASQGLRISTPRGSAVEPYIISLDWSKPQPQITRAVVVFHGKGRNVESYYRSLVEAAGIAGDAGSNTVLIAPQFLDEEDVGPRGLQRDVLRWRRTDWESGAPAVAPISISPFDIIDAILARLSDHSIFSNLKSVVLAGHSGGAQLVQRYAVVGRALTTISEGGLHVRFVIANPSSYLYFSDERPGASGTLAASKTHGCPNFNHWKYGPIDAPSYVRTGADNLWAQIEAAYARRDVIYLLGTADTDPHEHDLDVSCGGEAQGPTRFARGQAYFVYLHNRNSPGWNQRLWFVPGVAHSARQMFTSTCGVSALFDTGICQDR